MRSFALFTRYAGITIALNIGVKIKYALTIPYECLFLVEASKNMNAGMTISKSQELYPDAPLAPIIKL